jgi:hypothetical protein
VSYEFETFGRNDQSRWERKRKALLLPTYRQVLHWAAHGVLGDEHTRPGSGHRQHWTDHEFDKLAALRVVYDDFRKIDLTMSLTLIGRLWQLLDMSTVATVNLGTVTITATIPEQEKP